MRLPTASSLATLILIGVTAPTFASTILDEDFESYADTAALGGVWSLGDGTLDNALGNPGNSLSHPGTGGSFTGGNTNSFSFADTLPGAGEKLIYTADIYDDGTSANKRVTAGLRNGGGSNILEMGMYNGPGHYAYRVILFEAGNPSWVAFDNVVDDSGSPITNDPVVGWHTFSAEVSPTGVAFSLDLNGDGNINATADVATGINPVGFNSVRLGGPSDLSSTAGGANFDNVRLRLVPEPSSLAMLGLMGIALVAITKKQLRRS